MILADTNIILRLLLQDDSEQVRATLSYLERARRGRQKLQVHPLGIAEAVWVLEGKKWGKAAITDALLELCAAHEFEVIDEATVRAALAFYLETGVSYIDAFQAAYVTQQSLQGILSFDRDYDGLGIKRIEPGH